MFLDYRVCGIAKCFVLLQMLMVKYNIIGDIHGRSSWKNLVDEACINVFVGDFFDPYQYFSFEDLANNFLDVVAYKKAHPDHVVLLYGNHDYEYLPNVCEQSNRYDELNARKITWLLEKHGDMFDGVAYAIGNDYIVTHAGISKPWKERYLSEIEDISPIKMAEAINALWQSNKDVFSFRPNAEPFDYYGESPGHSPIWIRPRSLCAYNLYQGMKVKQIVGHTQVSDVVEKEGVIFVDCLGSVGKAWRVVQL